MTIELDWRNDTAVVVCPVCRYAGPATQVAEVNALGRVGIEVVRCPSCASVKMSGEIGDVTPDDASIDAYVEAGAGVDAIAAGLDVVDPGSVRRMLDVGCNYGFGMDLGRYLHGWQTLGVEPSAAGRRGASELGLDIRDEYLTSETVFDGERFDLVLASEVLEHVEDPHSFLTTLAAQLTPTGVLVLTTPAAEAVDPSNDDELVLIALSPGFHGFLASAAGLTGLLRDVGFGSVSVRRDGGTLRARASIQPGVILERPGDASVDRLALEAYYDHRASTAPAGSALENGMATRHLRSTVNRGDFTAAQLSAPRAVEAMRRRHGFDLDDPGGVAEQLRQGRIPAWNLVGLTYALGMMELLGTSRPSRAAEYFDLALVSIDAWRAHAGLLDGDSADLRPQAAVHRALAATRADPSCAADAFTDAVAFLVPTGVRLLRLRLFTDLVSVGANREAATFAGSVAASASAAARAAGADERRAGLDALYCLATHAAGMGDLQSSALWTDATRRALGEAPPEDDLAVLREGLDIHEAVLKGLLAAADAPTETISPVEARIGPAHGIEVYWVDASGVYVSGWAHHGNEPVTEIALHRGPDHVQQVPTDRPDLQAFWPTVPAVVKSGFALYLPGRTEAPLDLLVTTARSSRRIRLDLPKHPLPPPTGPLAEASFDDFFDAITDHLHAAPAGPVLAIGLRGNDSAQRDKMQSVIGDRDLVVLDIHPGVGVDVVADAHDLATALDGRRFALVVSAMVLEHVVAPWLIAEQANRVLLAGGLTAHAAPTAWPEHAQPNDFWRFTTAGLAELFGPRTGFEVVATGGYAELRLYPVGNWVNGHLAMPTHAIPAASWVLSRKVADLEPDAVLWPYDREHGAGVARAYPVDGLAGTREQEPLPGLPALVENREVSAPEVPTLSSAAQRLHEHNPGGKPFRATVSVILPLYNGERYVDKAVRSVLAQSRLPDELLVVDDGSSDGGVDVVLGMNLPFALTVLTQQNQGQSAARNAGIRAAKGELIAFIDQDDEWRHNHLAALAPLLEADPEVGWAYSDFDELDEVGRTVTRSFIKEREVPHPKGTLTACLSGDLMVLPSASVLRKAAFEDVGGFDPRLRGYEDEDLFVRMFSRGWAHAFAPVSTTRYRVHSSGSSAGAWFLESRMTYLSKLTDEIEVDHRLNRDFIHDIVLPRFFQTTLNEYMQAIAMRDYGSALALAGALTTITGLQHRRGWHQRLKLWLIQHPRRLRFLLMRLERLPKVLQPYLKRDPAFGNRTVVRAELRSR